MRRHRNESRHSVLWAALATGPLWLFTSLLLEPRGLYHYFNSNSPCCPKFLNAATDTPTHESFGALAMTQQQRTGILGNRAESEDTVGFHLRGIDYPIKRASSQVSGVPRLTAHSGGLGAGPPHPSARPKRGAGSGIQHRAPGSPINDLCRKPPDLDYISGQQAVPLASPGPLLSAPAILLAISMFFFCK